MKKRILLIGNDKFMREAYVDGKFVVLPKRKYVDENQDRTNDITIQINVGSCKGQIIEINRNIEFLKSLLTTYEHEKVKILDYIHSNL